MFAGINTFLKSPYVENVRDAGRFDVAVVGVPFDMGTTYRSGARFGPEAVRRISALYDSYSPDLGMDLLEEITIGDVGDIFVIPANIEKTFDQVELGISHLLSTGTFPVIIAGDHSIGYPDAKALAKHVDGRLGIVHFDRHIDTAVTTMDERMHTTHWSHVTDLPNVPPANLVQIGIGGWIGNHPGVQVAEERDTTVITMTDVEVVDPGYAPGTGTPEPGGMSPREALKAVRKVAQEGLIGMDLVEISPPYDVSDTTSQLGARVIMDTLATLVENGHLGKRLSPSRRAEDEARRDHDAGIDDS
jgi:agmatinase